MNRKMYKFLYALKRAMFATLKFISRPKKVGDKPFKMRFYKDEGYWFADVPQWKGPKANLMMVAGADTLLDKLGQEQKRRFFRRADDVTLTISTSTKYMPDGYRTLKMIEKCEFDGAYYKYGFKGNEICWLCDVTAWVIGYFPKEIYYSFDEAVM